MGMIQLAYASRPFGFDQAMLNSILFDARENNRRDAITGALICRQDLYLQMLEGPSGAVDAAFRRITEDDRHDDIQLLVRRTTQFRLFGEWAMRDDAARSWMWTMEEVADGAIAGTDEVEVLGFFERLAEEPCVPARTLCLAG